MKYAFPVMLLALAGCASTGVVPGDDGVNTLSRKSGQLAIGPPVDLENEVYREARSWCKERGKQMESVSMDLESGTLTRAGSATLLFKCI